MEQQNAAANPQKEASFTVCLKELIRRRSEQPKEQFIYPGIKENSIGFVFGPSKSGKTTFCENLAMSIAAGESEFLGKPICSKNKKVLFLSLEEFCGGRADRNHKQLIYMKEKVGNDDWASNYIVADCRIPRYLSTSEDWELVRNEIAIHQPALVIIDSMSRLHGNENIEESTTGIKIMKRLRELSNELSVAIIIIHHTPKLLPTTPLSTNVIAGSRILSQEADFAIGINKTPDKKIYIKDVAFRYDNDNSEKVTLVSINSN